MISSIKNASASKLSCVKCKKNNFSLKCLSILYQLGYIRGFTLIGKYHVLIYLRYTTRGWSSIRQLSMISKSNKNICSSYRVLKGASINNFVYSNSFIICSTSLGLFTDTESIILKRGGELSVYIS